MFDRKRSKVGVGVCKMKGGEVTVMSELNVHRAKTTGTPQAIGHLRFCDGDRTFDTLVPCIECLGFVVWHFFTH